MAWAANGGYLIPSGSLGLEFNQHAIVICEPYVEVLIGCRHYLVCYKTVWLG